MIVDLTTWLIDHLLHPGQAGCIISLGQKDDLMFTLCTQMTGNMQILTREVLVNEQEFHELELGLGKKREIVAYAFIPPDPPQRE
jgi:hypothetical protein